jgi:hypothetical protein
MRLDGVESTVEEVREFQQDMARIGILVPVSYQFLEDLLRDVRGLGIPLKVAAEALRRMKRSWRC